MELSNVHRVYFVGIGGIGMSALARYFVANGITVSGYDKTPSKVTKALQNLGIDIVFSDSVDEIKDEFKSTENTLVVYTPAIGDSNEILSFFRRRRFTLKKRSEVLGIISASTFCLAVAGTHGKTTTSALLGHIMKVCNTGASAFVGGIVSGYDSNLILGDKEVMVVEADEFDRSFMRLSPDIACVTSVDADHLDIYGDSQELENTFLEFTHLISDNGLLISKKELGFPNGFNYSINEPTDYFAMNIAVKDGKFCFDIVNPDGDIFYGVKSNLPGRYNVENTLAAFAMAEGYGLEGNDIVKAIESFKGIERRFNVFEAFGKVIVDDYAHHPSEIRSSLSAARELYVDKKIMVVFQPHLYSRTRDFEDDFAKVLAMFDEVNLLDIYPARELPIDGVTSDNLLGKINLSEKKVISKEDIMNVVQNTSCDVVMMLGAGDISVEIDKLKA